MEQHGKVLLADVHLNMLAGVCSLLEGLFDKTFMVADEASLLEAIEKIAPDFIVADLSFPITGGSNIVRMLQKLFPQIKVIILSVHDSEAVVAECRRAGAAAFVLKRTAVDDLTTAIECVDKGNWYVSKNDRL
ncbi:response regulator [Desulfogranum marinum]|uniref:response regulator n=1 Tax=Desulfogranum marinum TaxID=453220 RepID=UPI001964A873|nr:response regulator transcription factor [Desulfogranum marinum]MBM9513700.1 response regulator transcription factor [Desulfogranum marinum]